MKKILSALLALCLILSLAACASGGTAPENTETPSGPTEPQPNDPTAAPTLPTDGAAPTDPEIPSVPTVTEPPVPDMTLTAPTDAPTAPSADPSAGEAITEPTDIPAPSVSAPEATEAPLSPTEPEAPAPTAGTVPTAPAVTEPDSSRPAPTDPVITEPPAARPSTTPSGTAPAATETAPASPPATRPVSTEPTSGPRPTAPANTGPAVTDPPATQPPTVPPPTDCSHRYTLTSTQSATCTCAEMRTYTCSMCGHSYQEAVGEPASHTFSDATCTQPETCSACGAASGSALGHNYNSRACCTRCGEAEPSPIEIVIKVKDSKGNKLSGVTVGIFFGDSEAASGVTDTNGEAHVTVAHLETYQVKLSALPANVTANSSYTFSSKQASINLPTQPVLDPLDHSLADYQKGSTMADFTLSDTDGNAYRLYDLLAEKELVILDFWYCTCAPCKKEFPYFEEALNRYGSDISLLALNPLDPLEDILAVRQELGSTFPMLRDTVNLHKGFDVTAYPVTVFIDSDGKVLSIHRGAYDSQEQFFKDIDKYL